MAACRADASRISNRSAGDAACEGGIVGDDGEDGPQGCVWACPAAADGMVPAGARQIDWIAGDPGAAGCAQRRKWAEQRPYCPKSRRRDGGAGEAVTRPVATNHAYLDRLTVPSDSIVWRPRRRPRTEARARRRDDHSGRLDITGPITEVWRPRRRPRTEARARRRDDHSGRLDITGPITEGRVLIKS